MMNFPEEFEYTEEDRKVLRGTITNYLKGSDIGVLRRFASECGAPCEEYKNKSGAVDIIIRIILKEVKSHPRSNRGAPVKKDERVETQVAALYEGILGLLYGYFEKKNIDAKKLAEGKGMRFSVSQDHGEQIFFGFYAPEKTGGSIRSNLFFFNPSTDVVVDEQQALLFPFSAGDEIECVSEPQPYGPKRLRRVISVNSRTVDKDFRYSDRFDGMQSVFPDKIIPLSGCRAFDMINALCPILFGQRILVVAPYEADLNELFVRFASIADDVYSISIGQGSDDNSYFTANVENCLVCHVDSDSAVKVALVVERAKRLAENGKNAVIVINDLNSLLLAYGVQQHPDGVYGGTTYTALINVLKLFESARSLSTGGSFTVVGFIHDGAYPSVSAETGQLLRLAQCRLYVGGAEIDGAPYFDFSRSASKGESALSDGDKACAKKIRSKNYGEEDFIPVGDETAADIIKRLS